MKWFLTINAVVNINLAVDALKPYRACTMIAIGLIVTHAVVFTRLIYTFINLDLTMLAEISRHAMASVTTW